MISSELVNGRENAVVKEGEKEEDENKNSDIFNAEAGSYFN